MRVGSVCFALFLTSSSFLGGAHSHAGESSSSSCVDSRDSVQDKLSSVAYLANALGKQLISENNTAFDVLSALYSSPLSKENYIGEKISQLQHALQIAEFTADITQYDDELVLAALFHDVAHLLATFPQMSLNGEHLGCSR